MMLEQLTRTIPIKKKAEMIPVVANDADNGRTELHAQ